MTVRGESIVLNGGDEPWVAPGRVLASGAITSKTPGHAITAGSIWVYESEALKAVNHGWYEVNRTTAEHEHGILVLVERKADQ